MNITKVVLLLLAMSGITLHPLMEFGGSEEKQAEQIIQSFMDSTGINIEYGTEEYKIFMREIIWGEYPELTENESNIIANLNELDYVFNYAWENSGYNELYTSYEETVTGEAAPPEKLERQGLQINGLPSSERSNAIAYAYLWSTSGGTSRNPIYPDFGVDDCTNFIGQAMKSGGFVETGSGDECKYEDTSTEWYVEANPSPPIWCLGDFRDWEWSTSWSVPWPFRDYFANQNNFAIVHGWTTSASTAKYYLSPGDVIQLQYNDEGGWVSFHTMIVTEEDTNELYVTYHSNADGFDEVDKPLSSIHLGTNTRFMLVEIQFPALVYLPLIIKNGGTASNPMNILPQESYPAPAQPITPQNPSSSYPAP